jgi:DNA invertase Pin-like site-specific DNA recombinase
MIYFLYARKSTDVEDKQVLSIDAQLSELRSLSKREGLQIAVEFVEKQSAKMPGRPVFNDMIRRITAGEAQGIVCWKIDRLARNPVDGGQISWLLQQSVIQHIQTHDRSFLPADNVLMMSVELGMANQYIRDLSANTKRGQREKARRGEYPGLAPLGYINNPRTKRVEVDRRKAPAVRAAFELYAENKSRFEDISAFLYERGVRTKKINKSGSSGGKQLKKDSIKKMFTNPFYYGHFEYAGEIYKGVHTPLVSKQLFDKVQSVLELRGRQRHKPKNEPQSLCGIMRCGECGGMITGEVITKHQKNGNVHRYIYYRCTKKRGICSQSYIREETLSVQLSNLLSLYVIPTDWTQELRRLANEDEQKAESIAMTTMQELRAKIAQLDGKMSRFVDLYSEQDIDRDTYLERKRTLMSERKSAEEQVVRLEHNATLWLQPLRDFINDAQTLDETIQNGDLPSKKLSLQKIFGSNLSLKNRLLVSTPTTPYASLREARLNFSEKDLVTPIAVCQGLELCPCKQYKGSLRIVQILKSRHQGRDHFGHIGHSGGL